MSQRQVIKKAKSKIETVLGKIFGIAFLVFLWPLGLIFLLRRIITKKEKRISSGVILIVIGGTIIFFKLCQYLMDLEQPWNTQAELIVSTTSFVVLILIGLIFVIPGLFLVIRGNSDKNLIFYMENDHFSETEDLEILLGKSRKSVEAQIARLQKEHRLPTAAG